MIPGIVTQKAMPSPCLMISQQAMLRRSSEKTEITRGLPGLTYEEKVRKLLLSICTTLLSD